MTAALAQTAQGLFRLADASDVPFLIDSWLESYRRALDHVPGPIYWRLQRAQVVRLLERSEAVVACNPDDATQLFGYAVAERRAPVTIIHYLYVKAPYRREGIATALLEHLEARGCHYTHHTHAGLRLARRFGAHFNPYLVGAAP